MTKAAKPTGDVVLQEIWRIKNALSAARGRDIDCLFDDLRQRETQSGHRVVNLRTKCRKP